MSPHDAETSLMTRNHHSEPRLSHVYAQVQSSLSKLRRLTEDPEIGDGEKTLSDAKYNRIQLNKSEASSEGNNSSINSNGIAT